MEKCGLELTHPICTRLCTGSCHIYTTSKQPPSQSLDHTQDYGWVWVPQS